MTRKLSEMSEMELWIVRQQIARAVNKLANMHPVRRSAAMKRAAATILRGESLPESSLAVANRAARHLDAERHLTEKEMNRRVSK